MSRPTSYQVQLKDPAWFRKVYTPVKTISVRKNVVRIYTDEYTLRIKLPFDDSYRGIYFFTVWNRYSAQCLSGSGSFYDQTQIAEDTWNCDCTGWWNRKMCSHSDLLMNILHIEEKWLRKQNKKSKSKLDSFFWYPL